ncbi:MAG: protein kinase [Verrucomicrobiae bacterium]|nr:protein kinase [Verrucomicrobiae bacterium]
MPFEERPISHLKHSCPKCGEPLSPGAAEGLCARCLYSMLGREPDSPERDGDFGDYEVLEEIGEGGMGVVYRAYQGSLDRQVAIKVIKLGMDTRKTMARFDTERRALTLMDHPAIARVLDAGASKAGRPFFVMELVDGLKITDYCNQHGYSVHQRLDLFLAVCAAVHHAHQKGIIHRDLKPTNILVTSLDGEPVPKVIDFGIAKAVGRADQRETAFTEFGQFIGTPAYLSPEQAELSGADIDTRSDIYSLGVVLYELLTGCLPFDETELASAGIDDLRRAIRERIPPLPSVRLAGKISNKLEANGLQHGPEQIQGDLDCVVAKCLEKDRSRRYESANSLADDIRRHLRHAPIEARPPSALYHFRKSLRRNWIAYTSAASVVIALLLGAGISFWQYLEKSHAEREQMRLRMKAEANAYASHMNVAKLAFDQNDFGRVRALLNRHIPRGDQETDLRDWEWRWLWGQTRSDAMMQLCQRSSEIVSLTASHDGKWLAVGEAERGGLEIWDLDNHSSPQLSARLSEDEVRIQAAFSPSAPLLAYSTFKSSEFGIKQTSNLRLWDLTTGTETFSVELEYEGVSVVFSEDGQRLVVSTSHGLGGLIVLYQVVEGAKLERLEQYPSGQYGQDIDPTGFAANADLTAVAYGETGVGAKLHLIDLTTGEERWSNLKAAEAYVSALAFSPDGTTLAGAFGPTSTSIHLWDVKTSKIIGELKGHTGHIIALKFTPDGKQLVSSSADRSIRLWDRNTDKQISQKVGHGAAVWRLEIMPDGQTLYSGSKDGTVARWDLSVDRAREKHKVLPRITAWRFGLNDHSLYTVEEATGRVARRYGEWFEEMEIILEPDPSLFVNIGARDTIISANAAYVACSGRDGAVHVWSKALGEWISHFPGPEGQSMMPYGFIDDEPLLITYYELDYQMAYIWDVSTGELLRQWQPFYPPGGRVVGSPRGSAVEFAFNRDIRFIRLSDGEMTMRNLDFLRAVDASFSPDKQLLAINSRLGYTRIWDTTAWRESRTLGDIGPALSGLCFSPDGKRLGVVSAADRENALTLWAIDSGLEVLTLDCEGANFLEAKFSPDGHTLSLRDSERNLTLWQAPSWEAIEAIQMKVSGRMPTK